MVEAHPFEVGGGNYYRFLYNIQIGASTHDKLRNYSLFTWEDRRLNLSLRSSFVSNTLEQDFKP